MIQLCCIHRSTDIIDPNDSFSADSFAYAFIETMFLIAYDLPDML